MLINWLVTNPHSLLFIYSYKNSMINPRTADERLDYEEDYVNAFLEQCDIPDEIKLTISSQIHVIFGRNIFNINDRMQVAIKKNFETQKNKLIVAN